MTLTEKQLDYLHNRVSLDSSTKSRYDFKLKHKLRSILDECRDGREILSHLPLRITTETLTKADIDVLRRLGLLLIHFVALALALCFKLAELNKAVCKK